MPIKLAALTILLIALAAALLITRQQRIDAAHDTAALRASIEQLRYDVWRAQSDAVRRLAPDDLRRRIEHVNLALEPAVPEFGTTRHNPPVLAEGSSVR